MLHIKYKGKKCRTFNASNLLDLMHTPDLFGWVKRSYIEILIELSELICFGYDMSDTKMDVANKSIGEMVCLVQQRFLYIIDMQISRGSF